MISWKTIVIIIALLSAAGFLYFLSRRKSISFDFDMGGNIENLLGLLEGRYANPGNQKLGIAIDIPLTTNIKNNRKAPTVLNNLVGSISYQGIPVIQTNPASTVLNTITLAGKTTTPVTDNVQLLINASTIKFLKEIIKGNPVEVKSNFSTIISGKPFSINKISTIKKSL